MGTEWDDPNVHGILAVESLAIENTRYMGRDARFEVRFSPWLNAIIGGRGTGKSSLVEFLRITLRREDELPRPLREDLESRKKIHQGPADEGLLLDDSRIEVIYRKNGHRYQVQWDPGGRLEPILEEGKTGWLPAQGVVADRFPIRIYSQKQLFTLAQKPESLLRLIDQALGQEHVRWSERWQQETRRYLTLRARCRELRASLDDEPRLKGELTDVRRKIEVFEKSGHADVLRALQKSRRQERILEKWQEEIDGFNAHLRQLLALFILPDLDKTLFEDTEAEKEIIVLCREVEQHVEEVRAKLIREAEKLDKIADDRRKALVSSSWHAEATVAAETHHNLVLRLEREGVQDPEVYSRLVQDRQILEEKLANLGKRKQEMVAVEGEAEAVSARIEDLRRELSRQRATFLEGINEGNTHVRVELEPYENRDVEDSLLTRLPPEQEDRVETWFPEDSLAVSYCPAADGRHFKPLSHGSAGQKTAALLAFFLSYGDEPIVLDQPEDDLDNQLIYDLVVRQLRDIKRHRQVIVVTHNANIVVNGDAELVVALDARKGQSQKLCEGGLQESEVRNQICEIMEGGSEAFKRRYRRILGN